MSLRSAIRKIARVLVCLMAALSPAVTGKTVAYWDFNEGPVGTNVPVEEDAVADSSGNDNHLRTFAEHTSPAYLNDIAFHPVPRTSETNRLALHFTPNRDLYTSGGPIESRVFEEWTIEASFKPNVTDRYQVIVGKDGNPIWSPPPLSLKILRDNGHLELSVVDGAGEWRMAVSEDPIKEGEWYSMAGTVTASEMALWLMGPGDSGYVLQDSVSMVGAFYDYDGVVRSWTVGRGMWDGNVTDWFHGIIDQVRISEVALETGQFLASKRPGPAPGAPEARVAIVNENGSGNGERYLAIDVTFASLPAGTDQNPVLEASPDLALWEEVAHAKEVLEMNDDYRRVRLVSDIRVDDEEKRFLRGRVLQPDTSVQGGNPVFQGADPDVLLVDDTLWVYPTYQPGRGVFYAFSSKDLVTWRIHGPILDFRDIDWIPEDKQAWAPGIEERDGRYYLYYSVGPKPSHIGVAVADSPAGPFEDMGEPLLSDQGNPEFEAIDAAVFTDPESGTSYFYAGGSAGATLRVFERNEDMVGFAREIEVETPPYFTEGAFMHYRDGVYYLSYSHGTWWNASYQVHYATSESPYGPWNYRGKILASDENHKGPGHHSVLYNPRKDEWYLFYHRWNDETGSGPFEGRRKVAIELLEYDKDGLIKPIPMTDTGVGPVEFGPRRGAR